MSPRYWIEFRSKKKVAVFAIAVVLLAIFWSILPADLRTDAFRGRRRVLTLGEMMFIGWIGGWFLLLFVRGEDMHLSAPFDFQGLSRVIAVLMICVAVAIAGLFSVAFVA